MGDERSRADTRDLIKLRAISPLTPAHQQTGAKGPVITTTGECEQVTLAPRICRPSGNCLLNFLEIGFDTRFRAGNVANICHAGYFCLL